MTTQHDLDATYRLNGRTHHARTHIKQEEQHGQPHYQAVIVDSPLHGTYGGWAESFDLALDFLNLAMQAEGADEIRFAA